jgi:hypothetical protein
LKKEGRGKIERSRIKQHNKPGCQSIKDPSNFRYGGQEECVRRFSFKRKLYKPFSVMGRGHAKTW